MLTSLRAQLAFNPIRQIAQNAGIIDPAKAAHGAAERSLGRTHTDHHRSRHRRSPQAGRLKPQARRRQRRHGYVAPAFRARRPAPDCAGRSNSDRYGETRGRFFIGSLQNVFNLRRRRIGKACGSQHR